MYHSVSYSIKIRRGHYKTRPTIMIIGIKHSLRDSERPFHHSIHRRRYR